MIWHYGAAMGCGPPAEGLSAAGNARSPALLEVLSKPGDRAAKKNPPGCKINVLSRCLLTL